MSLGGRYAPIREEARWFSGEDRRFRFKVVEPLVPDPMPYEEAPYQWQVPPTIGGWGFEWALRYREDDPDVVLYYTTAPTPGGITIVAGQDPDNPNGPAINMPEVFVPRAATQNLIPGKYVHALARVDAGLWVVVAYGEAILRQAAER